MGDADQRVAWVKKRILLSCPDPEVWQPEHDEPTLTFLNSPASKTLLAFVGEDKKLNVVLGTPEVVESKIYSVFHRGDEEITAENIDSSVRVSTHRGTPSSFCLRAHACFLRAAVRVVLGVQHAVPAPHHEHSVCPPSLEEQQLAG
jgi:hypothetical protein